MEDLKRGSWALLEALWDGADGTEHIGLLTLLGTFSRAFPKSCLLIFQVDLLRTNDPMTIWKMKPKPLSSEPVRQRVGNIKAEHTCLGVAVRTGRSDTPRDILRGMASWKWAILICSSSHQFWLGVGCFLISYLAVLHCETPLASSWAQQLMAILLVQSSCKVSPWLVDSVVWNL